MSESNEIAAPEREDWKYALSLALPEDFPDDLHIKILSTATAMAEALKHLLQEVAEAMTFGEKIPPSSPACVEARAALAAWDGERLAEPVVDERNSDEDETPKTQDGLGWRGGVTHQGKP